MQRQINKDISNAIRNDIRTQHTSQVIQDNKSMKVLRQRLAEG